MHITDIAVGHMGANAYQALATLAGTTSRRSRLYRELYETNAGAMRAMGAILRGKAEKPELAANDTGGNCGQDQHQE